MERIKQKHICGFLASSLAFQIHGRCKGNRSLCPIGLGALGQSFRGMQGTCSPGEPLCSWHRLFWECQLLKRPMDPPWCSRKEWPRNMRRSLHSAPAGFSPSTWLRAVGGIAVSSQVLRMDRLQGGFGTETSGLVGLLEAALTSPWSWCFEGYRGETCVCVYCRTFLF